MRVRSYGLASTLAVVGLAAAMHPLPAAPVPPPAPPRPVAEALAPIALVPAGRPQSAELYRTAVRGFRGTLTGKPGRDALTRDLPKLTTPELVLLWDALWLRTDPDATGRLVAPRDLNRYADGFAGRFNEAALAALRKETDATRRKLLVNIMKPQSHTLTEAQAAALKKEVAGK